MCGHTRPWHSGSGSRPGDAMLVLRPLAAHHESRPAAALPMPIDHGNSLLHRSNHSCRTLQPRLARRACPLVRVQRATNPLVHCRLQSAWRRARSVGCWVCGCDPRCRPAALRATGGDRASSCGLVCESACMPSVCLSIYKASAVQLAGLKQGDVNEGKYLLPSVRVYRTGSSPRAPARGSQRFFTYAVVPMCFASISASVPPGHTPPHHTANVSCLAKERAKISSSLGH